MSLPGLPSGPSARGGFPLVLLLACPVACGTEPGRPPPLKEVTGAWGVDFVHGAGGDSSWWMPESLGSGVALLDHDRDGDLDIYFIDGSRGGRDGRAGRNRLFEQREPGRFVDVTDRSGLGDEGYGMGVAVGDIDNDGDVDVYVTNVGPDRLFRNRGDGTFRDATAESGLGDPAWTASATFVDYDGDGWLDLFVTRYLDFDGSVACTDAAGRTDYCGPMAYPGLPDALYRNRGDGTFVDVSREAGIAARPGKGLGVAAADLDRDGRQDIYVANDSEPNFLWINRGDGSFIERAAALGVAVNAIGRPEAGMGIAVGDFDGDDGVDLFVTHLAGESHTLYRSAGGTWRDGTAAAGLRAATLPHTGFGTAAVDWDSDGDLDLAVAQGRIQRSREATASGDWWAPYAEPNALFENLGDGRFRDRSAHAPDFRRPATSRGLAAGDLDGDADPDLVVVDAGAPPRVLRNETRGRSVLLSVVDPRLRRTAVGAEVAFHVGTRVLRRTVQPGRGYLSSQDPRLHAGLGTASAVDSVVVRWPDGVREVFPAVPAGTVGALKRGEGRRADG